MYELYYTSVLLHISVVRSIVLYLLNCFSINCFQWTFRYSLINERNKTSDMAPDNSKSTTIQQEICLTINCPEWQPSARPNNWGVTHAFKKERTDLMMNALLTVLGCRNRLLDRLLRLDVSIVGPAGGNFIEKFSKVKTKGKRTRLREENESKSWNMCLARHRRLRATT